MIKGSGYCACPDSPTGLLHSIFEPGTVSSTYYRTELEKALHITCARCLQGQHEMVSASVGNRRNFAVCIHSNEHLVLSPCVGMPTKLHVLQPLRTAEDSCKP